MQTGRQMASETGRDTLYWSWVAKEAARIGSDGCTCVSEWHHPCCLEHDLACHFGKDPFEAYLLSLAGSANPWLGAKWMPRRKADIMFGECNFQASGTIEGKFRSLVRYLGVRLGALLGFGTRHSL